MSLVSLLGRVLYDHINFGTPDISGINIQLSPCLYAIVMDRMTDEIREEAPWTMMFADDIVICSESKEQVEEKLESWRFGEKRDESQY